MSAHSDNLVKIATFVTREQLEAMKRKKETIGSPVATQVRIAVQRMLDEESEAHPVLT